VVFNPSANYEFDAALEAMGVRVWKMPPSCASIPQRLRYIRRVLREAHADVVHSWTFHDNPYAGLAGWLAGVPVRFGSLRNSLQLEGTRTLPPILRWLALHATSKLFVNANSIADELKAQGFPEKRMVVLSNCVDREAFSAAMPADLREVGIRSDQWVVGMVANLRPVKGHLLFVEAMTEVLKRHDDAVGIIVGQPIASEPAYPQMVRRAIEESGVSEGIVMLGFRQDVASLMKRMAVLCLPSESEGMPNVVLEALAAGTPVVATEVGGVAEIIRDGETGLLVPPGDVRRVADAISRLLSDRSLADAIRDNGVRLAVQSYTCRRMAERLAAQYCRALGRDQGWA
jgi:glycosyltransferase involved in cell wall biosynthesis